MVKKGLSAFFFFVLEMVRSFGDKDEFLDYKLIEEVNESIKKMVISFAGKTDNFTDAGCLMLYTILTMITQLKKIFQ